MRSLFRVYFLSAILPSLFPVFLPAQPPAQTPSCYDTALTQSAMNACASQELRQAESAMKAAYSQLLARASAANPNATRKIEAAQHAWEAFLDAQLDATFAAAGKREYGSVYPMCFAQLRRQLILERTAQLSQMLTPAAEGEVCTGDRYPQPR
ncbi:MAG: DUF1311 domain-containing protein [Acidobacteria bacterium]|nr:DUF1311 domain-containing protein [Acidobacteriota bacterium]